MTQNHAILPELTPAVAVNFVLPLNPCIGLLDEERQTVYHIHMDLFTSRNIEIELQKGSIV